MERGRWCGVVLAAWLGLVGCGDGGRGGSGSGGVDAGGAADAGEDVSAEEPDAPGEVGGEVCGSSWALEEATQAETEACVEARWVGPLAAAECARVEACGCPNAAALEGCVSRREARARRLLGAAIAEAVAEGGVWMDGAALEGCLAGQVAALGRTCGLPEVTEEVAALCERVFVRGGAGAGCEAPGCGLAAAEPAGVVGAACDGDAGCAAGLACAAGRCAAPEAAACTPGGAECGGEARCVVRSGRRECVEAGLGEACGSAEACGAGQVCQEGRCALAGGLGEPCADGVYCQEGLACRFDDMTCQALPQEGEACALGVYGPFLCAEGLGCRCVGEGPGCRERACAPLPGLGEACSQDARCVEGLGCRFGEDGENTCVERVAPGEACTNDSECAAGAYCDFGALRCRAILPVGAACRDGNECGGAGTCAPDEAEGFACAPRPGPGDACFLECSAGACETVELDAACGAAICEVLAQ